MHRESSGSTNRGDAVKLQKRRLAEIGRGRLIGPDVEKTTFADLKAMLLNDYKANGRRSLDRVEDGVEHLEEFFADDLALDITSDRIILYVARRQEETAASATINRELAALKRMFRLGEQAGKVAQRPHVAMLAERNTRKGFFEADRFRAVSRQLASSPVIQRVATVAYITGWRVKAEILTRQKPHVDLPSARSGRS
jgi:integrase